MTIATKRRPLKALALVLAFLTSAHAWAEEAVLDHRFEESKDKQFFTLTTEASYLKSSTAALQGVGVFLSYDFFAFEKTAVEFRFGTAFQMASFGHLFTAFALGGEYYFLGTPRDVDQTVWVNDKEFLNRHRRKLFSLAAEGGFEQLILSGSNSIYPAPGFFGGVRAMIPTGGTLGLSATLRGGYYIRPKGASFMGFFGGAGVSF